MFIKSKSKNIGRTTTPTILQMEAIECGAAALAIILAYYKKYIPLEELRDKCGISRNGSKASNILKAARFYDCIAKGFKRDISSLKETKMPVIVFWNFQHFLVVEGFAKNYVWINDPAAGPGKVSYEEFDKSYSGICLIIQPDEKFKPSGQKTNFLKGLFKRLKPVKKLLFYSFIVSLFLVIPGLIIPYILQKFVDSVLIGTTGSLLNILIIGILISIIIKFILTYMQQNYLLNLEKELTVNNSSSFFWHLLHLPISFFHHRFPGEISSRLKFNEFVSVLLSREVATNILNCCMIIFFAGVMFYYDITLTIVSISVVLINLFALQYVSRKRSDINHKLLQEQGKLLGLSMGGIKMMETFKSTGAEDDFFQQWAGYQAKVLNAQQELGYSTQILSTLPVFLSSVNIALVLVIGGSRIISENLSIGELVAFYSLFLQLSEPVNRLVNLGTNLQTIDGSICKLDDVLNNPVETDGLDNFDIKDVLKENKTKLTGEVELKNITFGYSTVEPPLIEDFNLKLKPGQRIALVGTTGSGKSTVAKLISGLYKPWSGEILFDNISISEVPDILKINSVAMVDQEIFLFEGTIRENLSLWDKTIPETNILQASKDAVIHSDITLRQSGYEGFVAEGGRNFSGGQRQRLEIARALVNNPTILVLDEATGSLDAVTEKIIDNNLRKRGCTCIIVAHRLSTIRDCDEIILLEKGKVIERGKHEDLVKLKGKYFELIKE